MRLRYILTAAALAAVTIATAASAAADNTTGTTKLASESALASRPYCGFYWGSVTEAHPATAAAPLTNVRAGRHECFDRLVLDMRGKADGYHVEYVSEVTMDASGEPVPLRGGARLLILVQAPAYDDNYATTYRPANPKELVGVSGWQTFRQIAWAGSFEGQSSIGLGVRARLPFRVFTLDGPGAGSRIVVDVAHYW